jgi:hypothetical protein
MHSAVLLLTPVLTQKPLTLTNFSGPPAPGCLTMVLPAHASRLALDLIRVACNAEEPAAVVIGRADIRQFPDEFTTGAPDIAETGPPFGWAATLPRLPISQQGGKSRRLQSSRICHADQAASNHRFLRATRDVTRSLPSALARTSLGLGQIYSWGHLVERGMLAVEASSPEWRVLQSCDHHCSAIWAVVLTDRLAEERFKFLAAVGRQDVVALVVASAAEAHSGCPNRSRTRQPFSSTYISRLES